MELPLLHVRGKPRDEDRANLREGSEEAIRGRNRGGKRRHIHTSSEEERVALSTGMAEGGGGGGAAMGGR